MDYQWDHSFSSSWILIDSDDADDDDDGDDGDDDDDDDECIPRSVLILDDDYTIDIRGHL